MTSEQELLSTVMSDDFELGWSVASTVQVLVTCHLFSLAPIHPANDFCSPTMCYTMIYVAGSSLVDHMAGFPAPQYMVLGTGIVGVCPTCILIHLCPCPVALLMTAA